MNPADRALLTRLRAVLRRFDPPPRTVTLAAGRRTVFLAVVDGRIAGWLTPPGPTRISLRSVTTGAVREAVVDDAGRFAFDAIDRGLPGPDVVL